MSLCVHSAVPLAANTLHERLNEQWHCAKCASAHVSLTGNGHISRMLSVCAAAYSQSLELLVHQHLSRTPNRTVGNETRGVTVAHLVPASAVTWGSLCKLSNTGLPPDVVQLACLAHMCSWPALQLQLCNTSSQHSLLNGKTGQIGQRWLAPWSICQK